MLESPEYLDISVVIKVIDGELKVVWKWKISDDYDWNYIPVK